MKRIESFKEVDWSGMKFPIISVYSHPSDYPQYYVARIFDVDKPTDTFMLKNTLYEIEADISEYTRMEFIPRSAQDVPALVGTWL